MLFLDIGKCYTFKPGMPWLLWKATDIKDRAEQTTKETFLVLELPSFNDVYFSYKVFCKESIYYIRIRNHVFDHSEMFETVS